MARHPRSMARARRVRGRGRAPRSTRGSRRARRCRSARRRQSARRGASPRRLRLRVRTRRGDGSGRGRRGPSTGAGRGGATGRAVPRARAVDGRRDELDRCRGRGAWSSSRTWSRSDVDAVGAGAVVRSWRWSRRRRATTACGARRRVRRSAPRARAAAAQDRHDGRGRPSPRRRQQPVGERHERRTPSGRGAASSAASARARSAAPATATDHAPISAALRSASSSCAIRGRPDREPSSVTIRLVAFVLPSTGCGIAVKMSRRNFSKAANSSVVPADYDAWSSTTEGGNRRGGQSTDGRVRCDHGRSAGRGTLRAGRARTRDPGGRRRGPGATPRCCAGSGRARWSWWRRPTAGSCGAGSCGSAATGSAIAEVRDEHGTGPGRAGTGPRGAAGGSDPGQPGAGSVSGVRCPCLGLEVGEVRLERVAAHAPHALLADLQGRKVARNASACTPA